MTEAKQALLPVTQSDRDAAASVAEHWHNHGREHPRVHYENVANGVDDEWILVQAFARHRISHSLPGDVGMREALRPLRDIKALSADIESKRVLNVHFNRDVTDADRAAILAAVNLSPRAALTPSALSGDAGDCETCGGAGEVFGHAVDCSNDNCALNGDIDSCNGKVEPCHSCSGGRAEDGREALGEALHALSARLLARGFFEEQESHAAYEKVVAAFLALPSHQGAE